ncbi:nucleotidyltransferase family protein [Sphaerotilus sp.]|uniref:nucleotidyltransferase family protein n=1 Tax=Sphaerotilus sp. TaxID=2093942 RepID=UPI00286DB609|nr:nucleotidyltransferase family protein [Sphaerotilus sp.]
MISGLLLAAGLGQRFHTAGGGDKLTARLPDGTPVVLASLQRLQAALQPLNGGPVTAVVREGRDNLANLLRSHGAEVVVSARAAQGMGASLADGVAHWPADHAVLVALGDMPDIAPTTLAAVGDALRAGASIVRPRHCSQAGHPVGFAPHWLPALQALDGDHGARDLLRQYPDQVTWLAADDDPGCLRDIDTPADLAPLSAHHGSARVSDSTSPISSAPS